MEQNFKKVKSSEYCISIFDGTHDSPKYHDEGLPLVTSKCILDNKIDSSIASLISKTDFDAVNKRSKVEQYDILISMIGINAGIVGIIKDKPNFAIKNVGVFRCKNELDSKYLFYFLQSNQGKSCLKSSLAGSAQPYITLDKLRSLELIIPTQREHQQHIVNTIGSVDDLIENYQLQIQSLFNLGLLLINQLNENNELINLNAIAKFEKGIEVGSSIYHDYKTDESIKYLRVGDLLSEGSTYIPQAESKNEAREDDILIAFDGAPGRNAIGLSGSFSSGIYKIICENSSKGFVYFELNSKVNQKLISDHSQGTTILHASKAIPHLVSILIDNEEMLKLNSIFKRLVYLRSTIKKLQCNKELLLDKYFTNQ